MKKQFLVLLLIASAALTGCSNISQKLSYALDLQEIISDKYKFDDVEVTINNDILTISLIDDNLSSYNDSEKKKMISEIEALALSLDNKPELSGGVIKFVTRGLDEVIKTSTSESMVMEWKN